MGVLYMLDYGIGNVRSLVNAVNKLGYKIQWVNEPQDILKADKLIFPGVGAFGAAMEALEAKGYVDPIKQYIASGKPFMGICVGMQAMFEGSDESPGVRGLGIIPGIVKHFHSGDKAVPHMGWNAAVLAKELNFDPTAEGQAVDYGIEKDRVYYFVHSYAVPYSAALSDWTLTTTQYGDEIFVSSVQRGNVFCTQFHPEKSGFAGLKILKSFLEGTGVVNESHTIKLDPIPLTKDLFTKRVIACLDVRANDQGDLVVTKGDQYDVREKTTENAVRNLGKPVDLARRYFEEGADEVCFLNITSFRDSPLKDLPMLEVLRRTSETVFVPLTIGGGIRDVTDPDGTFHPALEVAGEYFRSGADKVSIGSDAVYAAEEFYQNGGKPSGMTAIETIAKAFGSQAVVISVDPKRVYVNKPEDTDHQVVKTPYTGPKGESYCWYQCTVKGGRERRDLDVHQLVTACEAMGAGEILLNSMDKDGTNSGYDIELIQDVKKSVSIPVVASSGAGNVGHFSEVFERTGVEAALAAGIFHRREVPIEAVKLHLVSAGIRARAVDAAL